MCVMFAEARRTQRGAWGRGRNMAGAEAKRFGASRAPHGVLPRKRLDRSLGDRPRKFTVIDLKPMRVLVVEDDAEVSEFLLRVLREAAWAADPVASGQAALDALEHGTYDLVVLDVGLPDIDGFDVCRRLRDRSDQTPVLVLSARKEVNDRVRGLDAGADDYLAKPFAVSELLARLRALARRPAVTLEPVLRLADLELDPATRHAYRGSHTISLTAREFSLLEYLLRNPRRVLSRAQILAHVWDDNFDPIANAVDVLVGRLRRKIDREGFIPLLQAVRGAGYILTDRRAPGDGA
jgi:DNA-binding response OmpR family regulator